MKQPITARQQDYLDTIHALEKKLGRMPRQSEVAKAMKVGRQVANRIIGKLADAGRIRLVDGVIARPKGAR